MQRTSFITWKSIRCAVVYESFVLLHNLLVSVFLEQKGHILRSPRASLVKYVVLVFQHPRNPRPAIWQRHTVLNHRPFSRRFTFAQHALDHSALMHGRPR